MLFPLFPASCDMTNVLIAHTTGSAIGDMTAGGGLAAAFDNTTSQASAACATKSSGTLAYIGKDWGAGDTYKIGQAIVYPSNNNGFHPGAPNVTLTIQGSNNGSDWDDLGSTGPFADTTSAQTITATTYGYYRYHRIKISVSISNAIYAAEIRFYSLECL